MIFLTIMTVLLVCAVAVLGVLFFFLNKRLDKAVERVSTITGWCDTLMDNEETLSKDIAKLYREVKVTQNDRPR